MSAPVTYDRTFIGHPERDAFFDHFWARLPWENRENAPRRECWFNPYGMPYTYGSGEHARTYEAHHWDNVEAAGVIGMIMNRLNYENNTRFDCCFVNGYAHGRQHLGWHADDSSEMDHDHPIAVVSLGAEREIWFRPKPIKPYEYDLTLSGGFVNDAPEKQPLGHGSLLLMHAGMQRGWQHRIPKSPLGDQCGPRLSLTFRRLVR